jgi:hypothetical protein
MVAGAGLVSPPSVTALPVRAVVLLQRPEDLCQARFSSAHFGAG